MSDHGATHQDNLLVKYLWSTDHKVIAMQYLFTGMLMALIGGFTVYVFRMQLAFPGEAVPLFGRVSAADYNALVTSHGSIMIFWVAMPVLLAAFGNFLIPLMIGCDDMAFPRVNRLSYQIFLLSAIVLVASFFVPGGAFGGAWTAYPPLSASGTYSMTPYGSTLWLTAVGLEVGQKVRPRDEEVATDETLRNAIVSAVDDAVKKLAAGPPAKPTKR